MEALSGYSSESSDETNSPQSSAVTGNRRGSTSKGTDGNPIRKFQSKRDSSQARHHSGRSSKEFSWSHSSERKQKSPRSRPSHHIHREKSSRNRMRSRSRSPTNRRRPAIHHCKDSRPFPESVSLSHKQTTDTKGSLTKDCSGDDKPSSEVMGASASTATACNTAVKDTNLTPEEKLEQALAAAQALAPKLPTYLNPGAMNPQKYQTLQEKKKLLWSKKTHEEKSTNKWETVSFGGDDGDKAQAKFRRLMGINPSKGSTSDEDKLRFEQEKTLSNLEQQYETSRYMTHMARGAGLGYGADSLLAEPKPGHEAS